MTMQHSEGGAILLPNPEGKNNRYEMQDLEVLSPQRADAFINSLTGIPSEEVDCSDDCAPYEASVLQVFRRDEGCFILKSDYVPYLGDRSVSIYDLSDAGNGIVYSVDKHYEIREGREEVEHPIHVFLLSKCEGMDNIVGKAIAIVNHEKGSILFFVPLQECPFDIEVKNCQTSYEYDYKMGIGQGVTTLRVILESESTGEVYYMDQELSRIPLIGASLS